MTLLEMTVVILVLLSLVSILFVGGRAWKKGSDRAASILQIRNVQQAVRSFASMNNMNPGDTMAKTDIFGTGKFIGAEPDKHPAGTGVNWVFPDVTKVPNFGVLYMTSSDPAYAPMPGTFSDW